MAERSGRGALRPASLTCGIGRVGDRTQGYPVDLFWIDCAAGVRPVCGRAVANTIRAGCIVACSGLNGQADARDVALCLAPVGLLGSSPPHTATCGGSEAFRKGLATADSREGTAYRPGRGFDGPHLDGAKECGIRADDFRR